MMDKLAETLRLIRAHEHGGVDTGKKGASCPWMPLHFLLPTLSLRSLAARSVRAG